MLLDSLHRKIYVCLIQQTKYDLIIGRDKTFLDILIQGIWIIYV